MKFETVHGVTLPKIGFGAWRIGGEEHWNIFSTAKSMSALRSALEIGYTHFDTAETYASGHSEELIGRAIRETKTNREDLFITTKISPKHLKHDGDAFKSCENSLRRLKTDYIDLYLIHWYSKGVYYEKAFRDLNRLVRDGKVRHLGVSNFKLDQLKEAQQHCETPILTNQVEYRISDRTHVDNGVIEYCRQNDILITAYSPLEGIRMHPVLAEIANAHSVTLFQIALAWLVMQPGVITIPMSFKPQHIRENFEAAEIELTPDEIQRLNEAR